MSKELTEQQLFNQVSKAVADGDNDKLAELMAAEPIESESVETTPEETVEETVTEETKEVVDESAPPEAEQTEEVVEETQPPVVEEKSELDLLKEKYEQTLKDNHALKSQAGRVPHIQKRLKELDKKLEELDKRAASPSDQPSAKILENVQAALKGLEGTEPELAKQIAGAIAEATKGVTQEQYTKEKENLHFLREQQLSEYRDAEVGRLLDMYPNAPEVFGSQSWREWKQAQSNSVKTLAESDNADDVAFVFERYAEDMRRLHPELREEKVVATAPAVNAAAQKIEEERNRKKTTSVADRGGSAPPKVTVSDDADALFNKYFEQATKARLGQ